MSLYFILLVATLFVPLGMSFDKKLQFYRGWPALFIAIGVVAIFFWLGDVYMTITGVWGFNSAYHSSIILWYLPIEEWLFFVVIPYASLFLHESIVLYFPNFKVSALVSKGIYFILTLLALVMVFLFWGNLYTVYAFSMLAIVSIWSIVDKGLSSEQFILTFLVILIPFIGVNSILTGSFIDNEVVWYNNSENLNLRFITIPIEDFAYGFSLILFNVLLFSKLRRFKWLQI